jgi:hypothetical protein
VFITFGSENSNKICGCPISRPGDSPDGRANTNVLVQDDFCKLDIFVRSHIATDGQSVSLGVEPHLGLVTTYLLLFHSYGLVFVCRLL